MIRKLQLTALMLCLLALQYLVGGNYIASAWQISGVNDRALECTLLTSARPYLCLGAGHSGGFGHSLPPGLPLFVSLSKQDETVAAQTPAVLRQAGGGALWLVHRALLI